jgi:glyoxylase-like metal-dependent hydrolase (beta-lactamase superfamily II)
LSGLTLGTIGASVVINSFLPQHLGDAGKIESVREDQTQHVVDTLPEVEVTFLRCGSSIVPEWLAARGSFSFQPRELVHSAVLIRHPQATFLYDTGLCTDINLFLMDQSWFFKQTLANFVLEQSIGAHLQRLQMQPDDIDFALLSHLHWDHVSGVPDLPGVQLRVNSVEYAVANQGLLDQRQGLVRRLLHTNPVELIEFAHGPYEGFQCSYDLFGDGSIILVPLPGHTAGQIGMFVNRSNGARLFLIGDAAWFSDNYTRPATMHPVIWSMVTSDQERALQTLVDLHGFSQRHPEVTMLAMHDGHMQEAFMHIERSNRMLLVDQKE